MHAQEFESLVVQHLTEDFLTGSIRAIFAARKTAYDFCTANFESPEGESLQPLIARGKLNEYLRGVADVIPGCKASVKRSDGSPLKRTELSSGPVNLTAHSVSQPCGRVKKYKYRRSLAQGNQPTLLDYDVPVGETLYVLLLHGQYKQRTLAETATYKYLPGSIYLAFPTAELKDYAHRVNLIDRYPLLVDSLLPNTWNDEARIHYRWQAAVRSVG